MEITVLLFCWGNWFHKTATKWKKIILTFFVIDSETNKKPIKVHKKILAFIGFYWIHKKILRFIGFTKKSCVLLDSQKNLGYRPPHAHARDLPPSPTHRRVGTLRQIFDFGARHARCAAPPLKNRRLSPFGAKFTRGRSRKGAYEMFDFGARCAPRTVPTRLPTMPIDHLALSTHITC